MHYSAGRRGGRRCLAVLALAQIVLAPPVVVETTPYTPRHFIPLLSSLRGHFFWFLDLSDLSELGLIRVVRTKYMLRIPCGVD